MRILKDEELQDFIDFYNRYEDLHFIVTSSDHKNAVTPTWEAEENLDGGKSKFKCSKVTQVGRATTESHWKEIKEYSSKETLCSTS